METIKNDKLTLTVSEHGAELQSIKDNGGEEYLWQGDPAYWGRRSPILFPIVGTVWKNKYRVSGREYELSRHGFARDMEFKLLAKGESQVVYGLHDNAETMKAYPFQFNLAVSYKLTASARMASSLRVITRCLPTMGSSHSPGTRSRTTPSCSITVSYATWSC